MRKNLIINTEPAYLAWASVFFFTKKGNIKALSRLNI